eukprot:11202397-Lingulodinium_polyedra.AAC.1
MGPAGGLHWGSACSERRASQNEAARRRPFDCRCGGLANTARGPRDAPRAGRRRPCNVVRRRETRREGGPGARP